MSKPAETDLYAPVKSWLEGLGYEVKAEVGAADVVALRDGDKVMIRACGAYTSSYSSVGFNGFPPLDVIVL